MTHFLIYLWQQMWPNGLTPSLWTLVGIGLSHLRLRKHQKAHHEEIMRHVRKEGS